MLRLYIESTKLDGSRGIESCRALILDRFICRGAIESCPQQRDLDGSNSYRASIKQTKSFSMDRESVEKPNALLDRDSINFCRERKIKDLDR